MPRIVNTRTPVAEPATGARDRWGRSLNRPPMDWTGHEYKAPSELTVDLGHVGRISDPAQRKRGCPVPERRHTVDGETVPGVTNH